MVLEDWQWVGRARYTPRHRKGQRAASTEAEANSRLTASTAALLFVLLAIEGLTILRIVPLLVLHVFVGMVLVPPVLVKLASTGYRFLRYYSGSPPYRRKGPPPPLLRLLGPLVVVLTVVLFASGIALVASPRALDGRLLLIHKASFVVWFAVMVVHVLGHLVETARLAPLDWARRTRVQVKGASLRQWTLVVAVVAGLALGVALIPAAQHYQLQLRNDQVVTDHA